MWFQFTEFSRPNFNIEIIFALRFFWRLCCLWGFSLGFQFNFSLCHTTPIPCRQDPTSFWPSWRCHSCLLCETLGLWSQWAPVVSSQCGYQHSSWIWENYYHYSNYWRGRVSGHCVPVRLIAWGGRWLVESGVHTVHCVIPETFSKRSGQWWYWYIVEVSFETRGICNLIFFINFVCLQSVKFYCSRLAQLFWSRLVQLFFSRLV